MQAGRRPLQVFLALIAAAFALLLTAAPALAADSGLKGTIRDPGSDSGIANVVVMVEGNGFSGKATSDAEGKWSVVVPGAGEYTVSIDQTTLPSGLAIADATKAKATVKVFDGKMKVQLFKLTNGSPAADGSGAVAEADQAASKLSQLPQLTVDGILFGIVIALAAVGLSLVYGTTKLTNFAQGELITLGGLMAYFFSSVIGLPFILSAVIAVLFSAWLGGWAQNRLLWRPLRKRGTGLIAAMVVSIGFGLLVRYFYLFIFGGQTRSYEGVSQWAVGMEIGPILITPKDLVAAIVGALLIAGTTFWLLKSKAGKATRAVADNPALASASGIEVEKVISSVWIVGAGLAAFSGIMLGLQAGISWQTGFMVLFLVFAGSVLGGLGTAFGAIVGSLIVGILVQVSTLIIPTELKYVGALLILILILLVRPQGLLGKSERVG